MVNVPVRFSGKGGINLDVDPTALDTSTWSAGSNVRFEAGKVRRAPVYRDVTSNNTLSNGVLQNVFNVATFRNVNETDQVFAIDTYSNIALVTPSAAMSNVSATGFTVSNSTTQHTTAYLGGILYVNRETQAPLFYAANSTTFAILPNWPSNWTCAVLRPYNDCLVAFNVTQGATANPNMVVCSDAVLNGTVPDSWNPSDPTKLTFANVLSDMDSPIIDANVLGQNMVIYGERSVWVMSATGSLQSLYTFQKVFSDDGAINRNCSVEVNGSHYVFGRNDLYMHNLSSRQSIAQDRVRNYVFSTINQKNFNACFVQYNPQLKEVMFCYNSLDTITLDEPAFPVTPFANKAVVYNVSEDTWSLIDLPNVGGMCRGSLSVGALFDELVGSFQQWGGSFGDMLDGYKETIIVASSKLAGYLSDDRVYALDPLVEGSRITLPYNNEANAPKAFVERQGITLDQSTGASLFSYKRIRRVAPVAEIYSGVPMNIQMGAAQTSQGMPNYQGQITYNPENQYKIDTTMSGRYLSISVSMPSVADFAFAGMDVDVISGGRR